MTSYREIDHELRSMETLHLVAWNKLLTLHALFTLDVYVCINVTVKLTLKYRMGSDPFSAFLLVSPLMKGLNSDGNVDLNADVKCQV